MLAYSLLLGLALTTNQLESTPKVDRPWRRAIPLVVKPAPTRPMTTAATIYIINNKEVTVKEFLAVQDRLTIVEIRLADDGITILKLVATLDAD